MRQDAAEVYQMPARMRTMVPPFTNAKILASWLEEIVGHAPFDAVPGSAYTLASSSESVGSFGLGESAKCME